MTRETLLLVALQSGALFLALWWIFRLIPSIPANAKAWMWRFAFLKPLLSLLPFAVVTLPLLPAQTSVAFEPLALETSPLPEMDAVAAGGVSLPAALESAPVAEVAESIPAVVIDPWLAAWYVGVFLVAAYGLWGMYRSQKAVRQAEVIERVDLQLALGELLAKAHVDKPTRLLASRHVQSAMLIGGRSYHILLPQEAVEKGSFQDLRLMLAHEVAHIARRDLVWFGLTSTVQSIFFFNPMVWIAARCSRLDHESATDRHASQLAGVPVQTYAEMLLRATVVARTPLVPGTLPMAESYRTIHRRLEAMKHFNTKPTFLRRTATAALAMLTLSLLPAYELAAAYPDEFYPEELAIPTQTQKPSEKVDVVRVQTIKGQKSTTTVSLPAKTVTGKDKKIRYYVKTKKGWVEVTEAQAKNQKGAKETVVRVTSESKVVNKKSKSARAKVVKGVQVKEKKAEVANPIRAVAIEPSGQTVVTAPAEVSATAITSTGQKTRVTVVEPIATTKGQGVVTAPTQVTTGSVIVATPNQVTTGSRVTTIQGKPLTATVAQGLYGTRVVQGKPLSVGAAKSLYGTGLAQGKPLTTEIRSLYGVAAQGKPLSVAAAKSLYGTGLAQGKPLTTEIRSLYGVAAQGRSLVSEAYKTLGKDAKLSTAGALGYQRAFLPQDKSQRARLSTLQPTLRRGLYGSPGQAGKFQIVNTGDGKVKIIDANGKTKVYELKKGAVYELQGGVLREVKTEKVTTDKSDKKTLSWRMLPQDGKTSTWRIVPDDKGGKWKVFSTDKPGTAWRIIAEPTGRDGLWKIVPKHDEKGKVKWQYQIIGPDGKKIDPVKEEKKKADPPTESKGNEPSDETIS